MLRILLIALLNLYVGVGGFAQDHAGTGGTTFAANRRYELLPPYNQTAIRDTSGESPSFLTRLLSSKLAPTADLRAIDGVSLGLSYKIQGAASKEDTTGSFQKIKALHSISTRSFAVEYNADWKEVFRNTDVTIKALADMHGNILNFFGRGNDTEFNRTGDFRKFYRVNFSFYEVRPALRFKLGNEVSITAGPSLQYFVDGSNEGRYFNSPAVSSSIPDIYSDKVHGGLSLDFNWDRRDHKTLPTRGSNFNIILQGFEGLNSNSHGFTQVFTQFSFYKSLDQQSKLVLANRTGGGLTSGNPAFYQTAFLGSQDNLLGFRKNRFSGDHVLYNNLEARFTIPTFIDKIIRGKSGLVGFYDAGRVWVRNERSDTIHHGVGGGVFLTPLNRLFVRGVAGYSIEGLQATVALRQRF